MADIELVLVEDDPMVMAVNEGFIERVGGFRIVGRATSGKIALELILALKPRLAILDIFLPDLNGVQVLKEVRGRGIPTDFVMITAAHDVETVQEMLRFGAIDYVVKPFKFERLKTALEKYKRYVGTLSGGEALDQAALDSLMNMQTVGEFYLGSTANSGELPKGLREITLSQILNFLTGTDKGYSAEEVAEGIGLARVTARRYLDYMEKTGIVRLETRYGTVGRPVNKYRLT